MAFTGPYPTVFSGNTSAMVISATNFSGGVTNAGTIGPGGISVISSTFLSGGIFDSGVIAGGINIDSHSRIVASGGTAIEITQTQTFGGGINNRGTISGRFEGIVLSHISTFTGGVTNSGAISGSTGFSLGFISTFAGGITNSGQISAAAGVGIGLGAVTTFTGGIINSGTIKAFGAGINLDQMRTFAGGVRNTGTISDGHSGIGLVFVSTFTGGIINSGVIVGGNQGILVNSGGVISGGIQVSSKGRISAFSGIIVENTATFAGGITNSGTIAVHTHAIVVTSLTAFTGGVTNSGTVSCAGGSRNIFVGHMTTFSGGIVNASGGVVSGVANAIAASGIAIFSGGMTNQGRLVGGGAGLALQFVPTFAGAISNTGTISANDGIFVINGTVLGNSVAGGAIVNRGTISALDTGMLVGHVDTVLGSVSNSGKIVAGVGIAVKSELVFGTASAGGGINNAGTITASIDGVLIANGAHMSGGISNSGLITAPTGILIQASTVDGPIVDGGTIKATSHGILIDSASQILASKTAIAIAGPTFTGGISNFGVISGSAGIEIKTAHPVSIFDAGTIIGTGGTAIQFAGSGNTLTLAAGYTISGTVDPSGHNTFALGGTGSGTFDLSLIGTQFKGFTTFDVVGGTWTVDRARAGMSAAALWTLAAARQSAGRR